MPRYINANLLKAEFTGNFTKDYAVPLIKSIIDQQPTADVEEIRHGKWIYCGHHEMMGHAFQCSVCERWMFTNFPKHVLEEQPYCHCGAKMESVKGLEDDK
jgi:hypothetical protein